MQKNIRLINGDTSTTIVATSDISIDVIVGRCSAATTITLMKTLMELLAAEAGVK